MAYEKEIRQSIIEIAGRNRPWLLLAKVVSVEGDKCTVDIGDTRLSNVKITAGGSNTEPALLIKPSIGSTVIVADMSGGSLRELYVILYSAIDEIAWRGDSYGGIVIAERLTEWMNKVAQDFQTLQSLLSSSAVAGNGAPLGILFNPKTQPISSNNIENSKIKHG